MAEAVQTEHPDPKDDMRQPWAFRGETGLLTDWLICGAFPNPPHEGDKIYDHTPPCIGFETDYLKKHGGKTAIRPRAGMTHTRPDGTEAAWFEHTASEGMVDLFWLLGKGKSMDNKVAYAYTTVERAQAEKTTLAMGSDDGIRVWLNGKQVHDHVIGRGASADSDVVPVEFKKGANHILVKVENGFGGFKFIMRIADLPDIIAAATLKDEYVPRITTHPSETNSVVEIDTDTGCSDHVLNPEAVRVEILAPGGTVQAELEARRGQKVRFDSKSWPDGPYEVRISWTDGSGKPQRMFQGLYKGDWLKETCAILDTCDGVDADDTSEKALRLGLIRELILAGLGYDPRDPGDAEPGEHGWREIHPILMEYRELQMGEAAALHGDGFLRIAWIDDVDDSPQYCRAFLPAGYDHKKAFPMVVKLHGYNPRNPPYEKYWRIRDRHSRSARALPVIEMLPHGRGNTGYKGIGHRDVMTAVKLAQEKLKVDPDRIYLMGYSMGGGGTWNVGTRRPDAFAALGPVYGGWDYHGWIDAADYAGLRPFERFFKEASSSFSQVESLLTTPVFVNHGDADPQVDVDYSRYIVRMLQRWGYDVRYWEHPGWRHQQFEEEHWLIEWFLRHKLDRNPREVRLRASSLTGARSHWLQVEQREHPYEFMQARARVLDASTIEVNTANVLQFKLTPGTALVDHSKPVNIIWNGRYAGDREWNDGAIVMRADGYKPGRLVKNTIIDGGLGDRNRLPFVIVEGTIARDPLMRRICKLRAEGARDGWEEWQHYTPRYLKDVDVTDDILNKYSVILYGGPAENALTRKLIGSLPLRIQGDRIAIGRERFEAPDCAVQMIYPNPHNPQRCVTVVAATSPQGMYFCDRFSDEFDFCISDVQVLKDEDVETRWGDLGVVMGSFDHNWQYNPDYVIRGNPELRAMARPALAPTVASSKTDANRLYVGDLIETRAMGAFVHMKHDADWHYDPIRLGGKTYAKGIGVNTWNTACVAEYDVADGGWRRLKATIGIDIKDPSKLEEKHKKRTGVYFAVRGDGKELFRSDVFRWDSGPADIDIDVTDVKTLELEVGRTSWRDNAADSVNWADLRLEK